MVGVSSLVCPEDHEAISPERIFRYFCECLILTQSFLYVYPFYYCFSVSMFELL
jgi:hypothetical protein